MKLMKRMVVLLCLIMLAGCAQWTHRSGIVSEVNLKNDERECNDYAEGTTPAIEYAPEYETKTDCDIVGRNMTCTSSTNRKKSLSESIEVIGRVFAMKKKINQCMNSKGWSK
tara:strand:+ start:795 stop:1130 length:336 start_codon:yes stop_codon:yes gene_type:complete